MRVFAVVSLEAPPRAACVARRGGLLPRGSTGYSRLAIRELAGPSAGR